MTFNYFIPSFMSLKKFTILSISFILICLNSISFAKGKDSLVVIKVSLKAKSSINIDYSFNNSISIENQSANDTVIIKKIVCKQPTEYRYGIGYRLGNEFKIIRHTFFFNPGDSLEVRYINKYDIRITDQSGKSIFMDEWIKLFYELDRKAMLKSPLDFEEYSRKMENEYFHNQQLIDSLYKTTSIRRETKRNWEIANEINLYTCLLHVIDKNNFIFIPSEMRFSIEKIMTRFIVLQTLQSYKNENLAALLRQYYDLIDKNDANTISDHVNFYISNSDNFGPLTYKLLRNLFNNYPQKSEAIYQKALALYEAYLQKNGEFGLSETSSFKNQFHQLSAVYLTTKDGKKLTLMDIFNKEKTDFILIDLWASWCAPCRLQLPAFKKFKKEFEHKNIKFMSFSIDENAESWIKALKEENAFNDQYLLTNYPSSPLTKFFNIATIPRYLLLDKTGKVINDRFYLPTDVEFRPELIKLLTY
jgi:thiol-disulfide isomerase/thioredoxin